MTKSMENCGLFVGAIVTEDAVKASVELITPLSAALLGILNTSAGDEVKKEAINAFRAALSPSVSKISVMNNVISSTGNPIAKPSGPLGGAGEDDGEPASVAELNAE
jgi:hypothetical protein